MDRGINPSVTMKPIIRTLISLLALSAAAIAPAAIAQTPDAYQDHAAIRKTAEQFLRTRSAGLPGQVRIAVGSLDSRLKLAACPAPEAFLPNGRRVWGKTTVGVRCTAPAPWTIYMSATVKVIADYVVAAAPLAQGQKIGPADVATVQGDLTSLPPGIITDTAEAIGRTAAISLALGTPLRNDTLRSQQAVQQGQMVRLVSAGPGFRVSAEARALGSASEGQVIQAKTGSGQVVSGIAKAGGVVEVTY
jgi:flagella basal body P-ring formation protein FlgA